MRLHLLRVAALIALSAASLVATGCSGGSSGPSGPTIPSPGPSVISTSPPTNKPSNPPTAPPSGVPTVRPSGTPTIAPTVPPTVPPTIPPTIPPTVPPTVPPTTAPQGVYLGAWVNPNGNGNQTPTPQQVIVQTAQLELSMQRKLALHLHYFYWKDMKTIASNPEILDDIANKRIPVISWHCPDDAAAIPLNLIAINNGSANADLAVIGQQLAQLRSADGSPYPIMLRWFWEFNLNSTGGVLSNANANGGCFVGSNNALYPAQFINAWTKIYSVFHSLTPRPNTLMVWNPSVVNRISSADPFAAYFPAGYVDWIGLDGYNKEDPTTQIPIGFGSIFVHDLDIIIANPGIYGTKPLMVGETGTCDEYPDPHTQTEFLALMQSTLKSGISPWNAVSGLIYYDQRGDYQPPTGGTCTYNLMSGLPQWNAIGADPYFQSFLTIP